LPTASNRPLSIKDVHLRPEKAAEIPLPQSRGSH
jgi:hypothetical protein